jgi:hypothetical protein
MFVTLLRSNHKYSLLDSNKHEISDQINFKYAHYVNINDTLLTVHSPSGYKEYPTLSVIVFWHLRDLEHSAYLQTCLSLKLDIPTISFIDRKDLLSYLNGHSDSIHISQNENIIDSKLKSDLLLVESILKNERVLRNRASVMCGSRVLYSN